MIKICIIYMTVRVCVCVSVGLMSSDVVSHLPFCVTSPHAFQVISILYYNPTMMLTLLEKTHVASSPEPITTQFFTQWLKDADLYRG